MFNSANLSADKTTERDGLSNAPLLTDDGLLPWLAGGGEIAELIQSRDWSTTPLGPIGKWPQSLRTTISLCLASNFPINIIWGPEAIQIYNSGYKVLCGGVHPRAIGESYRVTWESAWPAIGDSFERAWSGQTSFLENQRMFLFRNGYLEETFFTFSLSPIRDEAGEVVGLFHPVTETTTSMINQRRTRLLRDISAEAAGSGNVGEAVRRLVETLADYKSDIPYALIVLEDASGEYILAGASKGAEIFTDLSKWPLAHAIEQSEPYMVTDVAARFGQKGCAEYGEPIQRACLLPIKVPGRKKPIGMLINALSTRLPLNETYLAFFDLLNNAVQTVLTKAQLSEHATAQRTVFQSDINDLKMQRLSQNEVQLELIESKSVAEAATRSKSAFLANMSHEIRTPLSSILGFTEILKDPKISLEERNSYLDIIGRNGQSLVRIIDDILDLSKIEAGKFQIDQAPLCLNELINDVLAMFSDRAKGKGLELNFDGSELPRFKIDSDTVRIRQILVNLLGNAIKFTNEGRILVNGSYQLLGGHSYEITLRVSDTGIGITLTQASTLFQAFNQADNTTTRHYGGTGLGLALSKKLANAMGGDISVEQNPNSRGSVFIIKLIVKKSESVAQDGPMEPISVVKRSYQRLMGWKILVIDDSPDNRTLMRILLEREGAVIDVAESALSGISTAQQKDFDLILMDIQMPQMDGYQALALLRNENYKKPIFALTAHTMKEERDRAIAAGFSGHISKPVNPSALVETILAHTHRVH